MKFETIKRNAANQVWNAFNGFDEYFTLHNAQFAAILPFLTASKEEREELREFAQAFEVQGNDLIAQSAKGDSKHSAWNRVLLKAREASMDIINHWDVRKVAKLLELFPQAAPTLAKGVAKGKALTCYMADNENADWMVELN